MANNQDMPGTQGGTADTHGTDQDRDRSPDTGHQGGQMPGPDITKNPTPDSDRGRQGGMGTGAGGAAGTAEMDDEETGRQGGHAGQQGGQMKDDQR